MNNTIVTILAVVIAILAYDRFYVGNPSQELTKPAVVVCGDNCITDKVLPVKPQVVCCKKHSHNQKVKKVAIKQKPQVRTPEPKPVLVQAAPPVRPYNYFTDEQHNGASFAQVGTVSPVYRKVPQGDNVFAAAARRPNEFYQSLNNGNVIDVEGSVATATSTSRSDANSSSRGGPVNVSQNVGPTNVDVDVDLPPIDENNPPGGPIDENNPPNGPDDENNSPTY